MAAKYDHHQHAKRLRERADECRKLAGLLRDQTERLSYERLANAYDVLARHEDLLSSDPRDES